MAKTLTVNNIPFEYPTSGDEPGWGGPATDWATEVTEVLNNVIGPDDILETSFNLENGQTDQNVSGLVFNISSVRSAIIEYNIFRSSDSEPNGLLEAGEIYIAYNTLTSSWIIASGSVVGNAQVSFSITNLGQIRYSSSDIGSTNYSGLMKFKARALSQT